MAGGTVTRFAPSPTGYLHLGHAFSAMTAARLADRGRFLLRIEDIDRDRCRTDYEQAIFDDLDWLGLDWPLPVMRQSDRLPHYHSAIQQLTDLGLTYPCHCRRGDIRAALSAPQEGALPHGPDGLIYPGTCRSRDMAMAAPDDVIRLNAAAAFDILKRDHLSFTEQGGQQRIDRAGFLAGIGDIILSRRGMGTSYHLAVVIDDAAQDVTLVTRGRDLFESTWIHVLLQMLLDLPIPAYHHHRLIRDETGKRLAKRDDARALRQLRIEGATPGDICKMVGL